MLRYRIINASRILIGILTFLIIGCTQQKDVEPMRSMYYWSTTFALDSTKTEFMEKHQVGRLYVRFFDVVQNETHGALPNATISFDGSQQECKQEIVPVVYILNDCMRHKNDSLPHHILNRVLQMCETHHIENIKEIQIDCDWTKSTRDSYFAFMEELHMLTQERNLKLSSTIRLHQLSQEPPKADKGVLMVYNTGDFRDRNEEKPILDVDVVLKYADYLSDYKLPLATALPVFSWDLLFRSGTKFVGIQYKDGDYPIIEGDTLIHRQVEIDEILNSKKLLRHKRGTCCDETVLYDISDLSINRYTEKEYEEMFD